MTPDKEPSASLSASEDARHRGRMGLALSWEHVPWWGLIIMIVGVIVAYSVLTSSRYIDAIYFLFDLPWNRQLIGKAEVNNQAWTVTTAELSPGQYTLVAEFLNKDGQAVGSQTYKVEVASDARKVKVNPLSLVPGQTTEIRTTTPTFTGSAVAGTVSLAFYDDFSNNIWRIIGRIWNANGVFMTIRTTLIAFVGALILGLIFGVMRVSSGSPDLSINVWRRLLIGLGVVVALWAIFWLTLPLWRGLVTRWPFLTGVTDVITNPVSMVWVLAAIEVIMFLLPALPYTISTLYVEIVRGVPMLVTILYMGFVFTPFLRDATGGDIDLSGLPAAVIGLAFGYGAYLSEVYRAGIQSIPFGQMEAARSLGMSYFQAMRYVILPQAIRVVLPPLGNDFISMLKDSSLISVIALADVLQQGRLWVSRNFRAFEGFNSVALMYLMMTLLLSLLVRFIERKSRLPGR